MASKIRFSFRDGKLYWFSFGTLQVVRPWGPRAGCWRIDTETGAMAARNFEFRIGEFRRACTPKVRESSLANQIRAAAYRAFLDEIPAESLRAVAWFPESHWRLLQMCNRCGAPFHDLIASTPGLALLLAERRGLLHDARLDTLRAVRRALAGKQAALLERFGFPPREATVRILRRIPRRALTRLALLYLRQALLSPAAFRLACHLPRLNRGVIRFLSCPDLLRVVTPAFLEQVALDQRHDRTMHWPHMANDLLRMQNYGPPRRVPPLRSLEQLRELHDRLAVLPGAGDFRHMVRPDGDKPFPAPPLPGTLSIQPIRTPAELRAEGLEMSHCAWSYSAEVQSGHCYFYRVLAPDRATLCIQPSFAEGGWMVREMRGHCNAEVPRSTVRAVQEWLAAQPQRPRRQDLFAEFFPELGLV